MAITNTPILGLPYAGADTDETYDVLAGLFVKDGQKLTLPEIVERYTPTIGTVYIKAADWTAADGTADAYDAKIKISYVEPDSMILIYPATDSDAEKAKRLGIRAKAASGLPNDDTFVIVRATGGDPTVADGLLLLYIALRGYSIHNAGFTPPGLTPPGFPNATVIGVDPYIATDEGDRDDIAASQRLVTEAFTEIRISLSTLFTGWADTNKALELRLKSADLQTKLDEYRAAKGLIDKTVSDLLYYYNKSQTLTKDEINALVSAIPKFKIEVVTALPTSNISETTVYLVKSGDDDTNLYIEFIRVGGKWEKLGTQTVDLTGYATEAWVNDILASYVKTVDMEAYVTRVLAGYLTKEDADKTYQPVGDYLPKNQGVANSGKLMIVGEDGGVSYIAKSDLGLSGDIVGSIDEDKNIVLTGDLAPGTYTFTYIVRKADGTIETVTIGTYTVEDESETKPEEPSYTNLLDGVTIYENKKMSTTSGDLSDQAGADATDFIKIPPEQVSDTLRISNVSLHASERVNNIIFYNESRTKLGSWLGVSGAFAANVEVNDGVYSFIPADGAPSTRYIRFSCGNIDENSIVTLGEEIV